jgi:hypothetical protein
VKNVLKNKNYGICFFLFFVLFVSIGLGKGKEGRGEGDIPGPIFQVLPFT